MDREVLWKIDTVQDKDFNKDLKAALVVLYNPESQCFPLDQGVSNIQPAD